MDPPKSFGKRYNQSLGLKDSKKIYDSPSEKPKSIFNLDESFLKDRRYQEDIEGKVLFDIIPTDKQEHKPNLCKEEDAFTPPKRNIEEGFLGRGSIGREAEELYYKRTKESKRTEEQKTEDKLDRQRLHEIDKLSAKNAKVVEENKKILKFLEDQKELTKVIANLQTELRIDKEN